MNKIFYLFIISFLTISCSDDNSTENETEEPKMLEIDSFSPSSVNIGDIVTIVGKNFDINETYVVKFNGVEGLTQETTVSNIKVEVPEGATTGEITINYASETIVIGTIEIIVITEDTKAIVYAIKTVNGELPKLVTIDPEIGAETELLDFQTTNFIGDLVYSQMTTQLFGISGVIDSGTSNELFTINLSDTTFSKIDFNGIADTNYFDLAVSSSGILYAIKQESETSPKLVSIDPANGNEIELLDFETTNFLTELVYNPNSSKLIAISGVIDSGIISEIFSIDLSDNTFSKTSFNGFSDTSYEIVVSSSGIVYGLKQQNGQSPKLITIDLTNGTEIELIDFQTTNYINDLVYSSISNELFAISGVIDEGMDREIYTINISDNTFIKTIFNEAPNTSYELTAR